MTTAEHQICPLCRASIDDSRWKEDFETEVSTLVWDRCGQFSATQEFIEDNGGKLPEEEWIVLSGLVRSHTDRHRAFRETITGDNYQRIISASGAPLDVPGRVDAFLASIAFLQPSLGIQRSDPPARWVARAFLPDEDHLAARGRSGLDGPVQAAAA